MNAVLYAAAGTGFTFLMTTLGAAVVFLFRKEHGFDKMQKLFMGFAAGVMISASIFSLILPAIEEAEAQGINGLLPSAGGFALGAAFMLLLDTLLPHLHPGSENPEGPSSKMKRTTMLVFAVTLHNIPEGMAVGLAFSLAAQHPQNPAMLTAAIALAAGIGIQNFPEGAAISLPLKNEGKSTGKAFLYGSMSGIVEPIFGTLTVLIAGTVGIIMPWLLSFAAGAMMFVVADELIPEANSGSEHSNMGTIGVMAGFLIMMILDVALG